jgi:hypothetical protein
MKTSATNRKLRILLTGIQNGTLIPRPEFQRRLVWSNKDKLAFLHTVLDRLPFPEIYIASGEVNSETGEGEEMLVDGQQRITTLYQYFKGSPDLKLDASTRPYTRLTEEERIAFLEYEVVIRDLGKVPIAEILEVFSRINSTNYALNSMEVHNARFSGELKEFGDELANSPFFEQVHFFTAQEIKRMSDTKFCLSLIITFLGGYFNRDDELATYLEKYNEDFEQRSELAEQFHAVAHFIQRCDFDDNARVWKKADFFSLFVELHRAIFKRNLRLIPSEVGRRLKDFYSEIDAVRESGTETSAYIPIYSKAALQASNDRGNRIRRGEIIQGILDPSYTPQLNVK